MTDRPTEKPLPLWCGLVAIAGCVVVIAMGVHWIVQQEVIGRSGGPPVLRGAGAIAAGVFAIAFGTAFIAVTVKEHWLRPDPKSDSSPEDSCDDGVPAERDSEH